MASNELSKYKTYETTVNSDDSPIVTDEYFGHFATVPRLFDVLCTIPLSGLTLEVEFMVFKADGITPVTSVSVKGSQILSYNANQNLDTSNTGSRSYTVEIGSKVQVRLRWKFTNQLYQNANPPTILKDVYTLEPDTTSFTVTHSPNTNQHVIQPDNTWKTNLLKNDVWSDWVTINNVVTNGTAPNESHTSITYTRTITRPKSAPTVETISGNQALKLPSGILSLAASVVLNFQAYAFFGATTKTHDTITAADIVNASGVCQLVKVQTLATKTGFITSRGRTINDINLGSNQRFVYAYPKYMGKLTTIVNNGAAPILSAFGVNGEPKEIEITNAVGAKIMYYVYTLQNPGSLIKANVVFT